MKTYLGHSITRLSPSGFFETYLGDRFVKADTLDGIKTAIESALAPAARFYLNHGKPGEPMRTESVDAIVLPLPWQERGLSYTASGYGARIPTRYMIRYLGRWRRVYCCQYGNSGTCYIGKSLADGIRVDSDS